MSVRTSLAIVTPLIRDTFRQACASGICWMMLAVTAICAALCLSVSVSGDVSIRGGDDPALFLPPTPPQGLSSLATNPEAARREGIETISGRMSLAFGAISFPVSRERSDAVHFLELLLAGGIAGTLGLLLALVWTAGFVPTFLEASVASVLLAKPVARWQLLMGKYLGVLTFVAFQVVLFVVLTWLALGVRTDVWDMTYWWCIPLLLLQFAIFYSFSVLLGVMSRSTVVCVFGSVLFWLLAWGINYGSVVVRTLPDPESRPAFTLALSEAGYWISPKPIDAGLMLFNALEADQHFDKPGVFRLVESGQTFSPVLSILSSLFITAALLALSAHEFKATEY
jgi:ABC-type transport system involved in multi-copper enzyme maturation permease subunit